MPSNQRLRDWLTRLPDTSETVLTHHWRGITSDGVLRELAALIDAGQDAVLEWMWLQVTGEDVAGFLGYLFTESADYRSLRGADAVDHHSIVSALQGMVSGALAVRAAIRGDAAAMALWVRRTVGAWTGDRPTESASEPLLPADGAVDELLQLPFRSPWMGEAGKHRLGPARRWVQSLCVLCLPGRRVASQEEGRTAPVVMFEPGRGGHIAWLRVQMVDGGTGEFYADPASMALQPMAASFLATTRQAWTVARAATGSNVIPLADRIDVCWHMTGEAFAGGNAATLQGGSHAAQLALALAQLLSGQILDPGLTVTATLEADGSLGPVDHVPEKIAAALRLADGSGASVIGRVGVHPANAQEARTALAHARRSAEDACIPARCLTDLLPHATGHLDELRRLLRGERDRILDEAARRIRSSFASWDDLRERIIPMRCRRRRYHSAAAPSTVGGMAGEFVPGELEDRSAFRDGITRVAVLADPGHGKTMLLWAETCAACGGALAQLADTRSVGQALRFGVYVRARDLAEALAAQGAPARPADVAACLAALLVARHHLRDTSAGFLEERILSGACTLSIDALDETPGTQRTLLDHALEMLGAHTDARIILSARREGFVYSSLVLPPDGVVELAPFDDGQIRQAIDIWLRGAAGSAEAMWRAIRSTPNLRVLLRSPHLLRIACASSARAVAEGSSLPRLERTVDLFGAWTEDMLASWVQAAPVRPNLQQRDQLLLLAGAVARKMLSAELLGGGVGRGMIRRIVREEQGAFPALAERPVLDDLCQAGILLSIGPDALSPDFAFAHQNLAEYLAASHLAGEANRASLAACVEELDQYADVPAAGQRIVVFLAGLLDDPMPLLQHLSDPERDDLFRHRLALAAMCLPEVAR